MFNPGCQEAERLLSAGAGPGERAAHQAQCPSCRAWSAEHQTLVQHLQGKSATLSAEKLETMRAMFAAAPTPRAPMLTRPRVLSVIALAASLLLLVWVARWQPEETTTALAGGLGPHQGMIQEKDGSRVELVAGPDKSVRVYLFDTRGNQQRASGEVKMKLIADAFAPKETKLKPSEDGSFLVGRLPEGKGVAEVTLEFPSGASFVFPGVMLGEPVTLAVAPAVEVVTPPAETPGGVALVGEHKVAAEVLAKGEVRVRVYQEDATLLPASEFSLPEITLEHEKKKHTVKLTQREGYWVGYLSAPVEISAGAQVVILCQAPLVIRGVSYEPARVVFTRYALKTSVRITPTIITPTVIIKYNTKNSKRSHKHKKGSHK